MMPHRDGAPQENIKAEGTHLKNNHHDLGTATKNLPLSEPPRLVTELLEPLRASPIMISREMDIVGEFSAFRVKVARW